MDMTGVPLVLRGLRHAVLAGALAAVAWGLPVGQALSQPAVVPERFVTSERDVDYPGADLRAVFDSTLAACQALCLGDPDCAGFTFNARNGACFPKRELGAAQVYEGAISGRVGVVAPQVLAQARDAAQRLDFLRDTDLDAARDHAVRIGTAYNANRAGEAGLLRDARAHLARGDHEAAILYSGAAVTVADSAGAWLLHGQALFAASTGSADQRRDRVHRAQAAAINAYLRAAGSDTEAAEAMVTLARALDAQGRGRDTIPALRLAESHRPGVATEALALAQERHGFRLLEHRVEANSATPRICAVFSEELATAGVDYAPFVQVPASGLAIEVEGWELCVTGLRHGQRYGMTLRAGLPAASGETLVRAVDIDAYVRDRAPMVRFAGRGYVLPVTGARALPVETVNTDQLELTLSRVDDRNLVSALRDDSFAEPQPYWSLDRMEARLTEPLWRGTAEVSGTLNEVATTRLPLDAVGALEPGVYVLRAEVPGTDSYEVVPAVQWFMVSDLGISTLSGNDGLHVVVQALSTGAALGGVEVALVARSNRVLDRAVTDAQGRAHFAAPLTRGQGNAAPAMVLAERAGADMTMLSLLDAPFDLSDRGVAGRAAPGPVDVFLSTDRGAYRAGETVHVTALARDGDARAIDGLPLSARLTRPDGVEYSRATAATAAAGGHVFHLPLGAAVPRGVWRLDILADPDAPALAGTTLLVEDFEPERIDMTLALPDLTDDAPLDLRAATALSVDAQYLFGAPAAGLMLDGQMTLRPSARLADWPGFRFGRHDRVPDLQRVFFDAAGMTDTDGQAMLTLPLGQLIAHPGPMTAEIAVQIADSSGRPVERVLRHPVLPSGPMVGIRPQFDGPLREGASAAFDLIATRPDGRLLPGALDWQIDRVERRYQWYAIDGSWYWEPVTTRTRIDAGRAELTDTAATIDAALDWGAYELRVARTDADGAVAESSVPFTTGWYAQASARDTPDMLEMSLDRADYAPGDTAMLRMVPRAAGMALVSVIADRVIDMQLVEVAAGETVIPLPVTDAWGAGVYVTASVIRPAGEGDTPMPGRALGLAHAAVAPGDRSLDVTMDLPVEAAPRGPVTVTLRTDAGDADAWATLALVDRGILNLTGHAPPDPAGHYFGQRALGVELRDIYGRLIDASQGALGQVRSGGDAARLDRSAPPPDQELVAFFSGPVRLEGGQADLTFDLPAFNGQLRAMAMVWSPRAVGAAHGDVLVRDPVVVQTTAPRFLAPGDRSRLLVELTHATGPAGEMAVAITGEGLDTSTLPGTVTLSEGGAARLELPLRALDAPGTQVIEVSLTTPDGTVLTRTHSISVQRNDPEVARSSQFELAPGQRFSFDDQAMAGFLPGTARATLTAGRMAGLDLAGLFLRLGQYPYGCTEQTVSQALPLLLAGDLAERLGQGSRAERDAQIAQAIDRVLANQTSEGSFGLWSPGWGDAWLDAYATDFLWRADAAGHLVPPVALRMALDNLRNAVRRAGDLRGGDGPAQAYAMLVLARAGEGVIGDLRYFADTRAEAFDTPLAAAQLGAALATHGDLQRSDAMFALAAAQIDQPATSGWRNDYGTALRDAAGVLALAVESGSTAIDRDRLLARLGARPSTHELSPQEAVWSLMAAQAMAEADAAGLTLDGAPVAGPLVQLYAGVPAVLQNTGERAVTVTLTGLGVSEVPEPAAGTAYALSRTHYTLSGDLLDLSAVELGTRLVTVLEVRAQGDQAGRLMIDDPLPAGFEIDNPNLLRTGDVAALEWLDLSPGAEMTEARAERFLAAVDWRGGDTLRLAYIARAVSPGVFHHPAASVEDMYRPTQRARTAPGQVTVRQ